jgi:UDP-N-acetylglucosamine acyltransferase
MRIELAPRGETRIHPTALIDRNAQIGTGVSIGPYAVIGPEVVIGDHCTIGAHAIIERDTTLGAECFVSHGASLGGDPQDLKYHGEKTQLVIGDRTSIREFATLNRGTSATGRTVVGSDCLLMAYTHVAHDCVIGDHVIISNSTQMAGHVTIEDWAVLSGMVAIVQFLRIGTHAFVGAYSKLVKDVPPYCRVDGNPAKLYGLNSVGLDRRGFDEDVRRRLKSTYRTLFQSGLNVSQGTQRAEAEAESIPEVLRLLSFVKASERGITI